MLAIFRSSIITNATILWFCFIILGCHTQNSPKLEKKDSISQSILKIKSFQQVYDWTTPWNTKDIKQRQGLGITIGNKLILTLAKNVSDAKHLEVILPPTQERFTATVTYINEHIGLALLRVESASFWKQVKPATLAQAHTTNVSVQRWVGHHWSSFQSTLLKDDLFQIYPHGPYIPISKIKRNSGNLSKNLIISTNGKILGLGYQRTKSEIYILPSSFLMRFVKRASKLQNTDLPQRGFEASPLLQPAAKQYFKLPKNLGGILVTRVYPYGVGSKELQINDFITKINNHPVGDGGTVLIPNAGAVFMDYLFLQQEIGTIINIEILRDGKTLLLESKAESRFPEKLPIPRYSSTQKPEYIIQGGLVFQELSANYLDAIAKDWGVLSIKLGIYKEHQAWFAKNREKKRIILSHILPDSINIGYQEITLAMVDSINEHKITSLEDVKKAFLEPQGEFHNIQLMEDGRTIILPNNSLEEANKNISRQFGIF